MRHFIRLGKMLTAISHVPVPETRYPDVVLLSNSTPPPWAASCNSDQQPNDAFALFNANALDMVWTPDHSGAPQAILDFGLGNGKAINEISIKAPSVSYGGGTFHVYGSDNGSSWTSLFSQLPTFPDPQTNVWTINYSFANTHAYRYYKIVFTDSYVVWIGGIHLYTAAVP